MLQQLRPPFDLLEARNGVCVADGWGLKIHVKAGHLIVEDGIGQSRRTRRYHKATSGLHRLVILGHSGYQTLEATRWLHDAKINMIHIDTDGTALSATSHGINHPVLRRAQALATSNDTGVDIIRYLLGQKIRGQRDNSHRLNGEVAEINAALDAVERAETLDALRIQERQAALSYWRSWSTVEMAFVRDDQPRVPDHWHRFDLRRSTQTTSGRRAVTPVNAILNYLYSLLEAEARIALLAAGLDPGLGILHVDKYARESFAFDLMEAVRPKVDAYVLDLLDSHRFRARDFHETRTGECRIARPLAHALSDTVTSWRNHFIEPAGAISDILMGRPPAAGSEPAARRSVSLARNCKRCGNQVDGSARLCPPCSAEAQEKADWLTTGRQRLQQLRKVGEDPAHGGVAGEKRGEANRQHQDAVADWNATQPRPDDREYLDVIFPGLQNVSLREMSEATGLSLGYCSFIKRGVKIPHPRHWPTLRTISVAGALTVGVPSPLP